MPKIRLAKTCSTPNAATGADSAARLIRLMRKNSMTINTLGTKVRRWTFSHQ